MDGRGGLGATPGRGPASRNCKRLRRSAGVDQERGSWLGEICVGRRDGCGFTVQLRSSPSAQPLGTRILVLGILDGLYGYAPHEVIGRPVSIIVPPVRHAEMLECWKPPTSASRQRSRNRGSAWLLPISTGGRRRSIRLPANFWAAARTSSEFIFRSTTSLRGTARCPTRRAGRFRMSARAGFPVEQTAVCP
jgi:hypothetical protein